MSAITFGGLASGLDSNSIVEKLVAIEKQPEAALQKRQANAKTQSSVVAELISGLQSLGTGLGGLDTADQIRSLAASSTNPGRVQVSSSGAAQPGRYSLSVTQLAQAPMWQSHTVVSAAAGAIGAGTLQIQLAAAPALNISYDATNSIGDVAAKINALGSSVTASVLYDGNQYRLLVQGQSTGAANELQISETGSGLGFGDAGARLVSAADAAITVNGISVTRPTNTMSDVLPGLTFGVTSVSPTGDPPTTIIVANDPTAAQKKLQSVVDTYNTVAGLLATQLSYNGAKKGSDTLFGDGAAQSLQRALGRAMTTSYSDASGTTSAAALGLGLGPTGLITLDATKLTNAFAADPQGVQRLLIGSGTNGLGKALRDIVSTYTDANNGVLVAKQTAIASTVKSYDVQIAAIDRRATAFEATLRAQYTAMEKIIAGFNSQQQYLDQLSGFATSSKKA